MEAAKLEGVHSGFAGFRLRAAPPYLNPDVRQCNSATLDTRGLAEQQAAIVRRGGFHKRPFAHRVAGHDDSSRICFRYPVSELPPKAICL
jgi:hypothetical protein